MIIQTFNRSQLADYIESETYRNQVAIPISYHRGISHINNPRAGAEDVLLFVSKNEDSISGYLGVMPDQFTHVNGRVQKIGFMSCMWVSPEARGQGIAVQLIKQALEAYEGRLVATDYVPGTKKIYDRTGGYNEDPYILSGLRLYVRANLTRILPPKKSLFAKIKPLLKLADRMINTVADFRFINKKFTIPEGVRIEMPETLSDADYQFIKSKQAGEVFARDLTSFNWMLKYPWILESQIVDELHQKYYFSSFEKKCTHRVLRIFNKKNQLIAIMIFLHRNDHLKLHYGYFEASGMEEAGNVLFAMLAKWKIKTFTSFHTPLNEWIIRQKSPALFTKEIKRYYVIAKSLWSAIHAKNATVQSGDIDAGFT